MAEINAKDVMNLRNKTGLSMMACKAALAEAAGDPEKAEELLRKQLKGKMDTRTDRAAGEGKVAVLVNADRSQAAIVEIRAETDFTAKSEKLGESMTKVLAEVLKAPAGPVASNAAIAAALDEVRISTNENCSYARGEKLAGAPGAFAYYVHHDGKTASLVQGTGSVPEAVMKDVCMHVVAAVPRPQGLSASEVPAAIVEKNLAIGLGRIEQNGLGDTAGTIVHLFERDCTVQRRHQKVVERAPAPYLDDAGRATLTGYAVAIAKAAGGAVVILLGGRLLMRPLFRLIARSNAREVFTATALLLVAGAAGISELVGLPASLGAFAAGVLLSESEYRHELQADVEPFEGLLLGFFFISVGMSADLKLMLADPALILLGALAMMTVKVVVILALERLRRQPWSTAARTALALPQGSEFAFVLFPAAVAVGVLPQKAAGQATLIIALSMLLSPLLFAASEAALIPRLKARKAPPPRPYDTFEDQDAPVIVAGLGRVGQIVARVLRMQGIAFTALEKDSEQVEQVRRFGSKVFFGDPSRTEVLRAAGADKARLLILATSDTKESLEITETVKRNFPDLKIVARARDRYHAHQLLDLGVTNITRETYLSSLHMAEEALKVLGHPPDRARREVGLFRDYDEQLLLEQRAIRDDERLMIQSTRNAAEELAGLLEADRQRARLPEPRPVTDPPTIPLAPLLDAPPAPRKRVRKSPQPLDPKG